MKIQIRERNGIIIFDIIHEHIVLDGDSILKNVKEQLDKGKRNLLLNCDKVDVDLIDTFMVGEILASIISTKNVTGTIKLLLPRNVRYVFERVGIQKVVEIFEDEEAAIKSFF